MKKLISFFILLVLTNCSLFHKHKPEFLFLQKAKTVTYDGKILKLSDAFPSTIYFSNRPYRIVGHVRNHDFIRLWNETRKDSFKKVVPNGAISYVDKKGNPDVAVVELLEIKVEKKSILYHIKLLNGNLPDSASDAILFIDSTSCPKEVCR